MRMYVYLMYNLQNTVFGEVQLFKCMIFLMDKLCGYLSGVT